MSVVSIVDGTFFTMHKVPNTNVFIIIKNNQLPTFDSCFCGFIKVRVKSDQYFDRKGAPKNGKDHHLRE